MQLIAVSNTKFWQSASKLLIGNSAAQLLFLAMTPILTRLYTPEDFSGLAVYIALVTIGLSLTCLKLDVAIPIAKTKTDAKNLFFMSSCSSLIIGLLLFGLALIVIPQLYYFEFRISINNYILLAPIGIGLGGVFSAFQYWAVRHEKFLAIGGIRFFQASVCVLIQVAIALSFSNPYGLVVGHLSMPLCGLVIYLLYSKNQYVPSSLSKLKFVSMQKTFWRFDRFPKFSILTDIATNAGLHLPIIIVATLVSPVEAGFLFLAMRVIGTPISIASVSVGQIYLSKLNSIEAQKKTKLYTRLICKNIIHFLLLPLAFVAIFSSELFAFVFGNQWQTASELILLMLPWYVFQSLASPISNLLYAQKRQRLLLGLSIFGLLLRTVPLIVCLIFSPTHAMMVLFVCAALYYFIALTIFLAMANLQYLEITKFYLELFVKITSTLGIALALKIILGMQALQ
jgi:O-antigen/teichoic acid export membrane protein